MDANYVSARQDVQRRKYIHTTSTEYAAGMTEMNTPYGTINNGEESTEIPSVIYGIVPYCTGNETDDKVSGG